MKVKTLIGRAEYCWLTDVGIRNVPARIDTGARTSAIWATNIHETSDGLSFVLFDKTSPLYTASELVVKRFSKIIVASSTGHTTERYKIPVTLQIRDRRINTFATLADRSSQAYPILIGRNTLNGKFIVDVQLGSRTLNALDQDRYNKLQSLL